MLNTLKFYPIGYFSAHTTCAHYTGHCSCGSDPSSLVILLEVTQVLAKQVFPEYLGSAGHWYGCLKSDSCTISVIFLCVSHW